MAVLIVLSQTSRLWSGYALHVQPGTESILSTDNSSALSELACKHLIISIHSTKNTSTEVGYLLEMIQKLKQPLFLQPIFRGVWEMSLAGQSLLPYDSYYGRRAEDLLVSDLGTHNSMNSLSLVKVCCWVVSCMFEQVFKFFKRST